MLRGGEKREGKMIRGSRGDEGGKKVNMGEIEMKGGGEEKSMERGGQERDKRRVERGEGV